MGYRSDVNLYLEPAVAAKLKELAENDPDVKEMLEYAVSSNAVDPIHNYYWDQVKWYSDDPEYYPGVCKIEEFLKEQPKTSWMISAVGEDGERWGSGLLFRKKAHAGMNPARKAVDELAASYGAAEALRMIDEATADLRERLYPKELKKPVKPMKP